LREAETEYDILEKQVKKLQNKALFWKIVAIISAAAAGAVAVFK